MKYAYILVAVILLSLPQISLAQECSKPKHSHNYNHTDCCDCCNDNEVAKPKSTTFNGGRLWVGFSGVTILGTGRAPLNLAAPSIGLSWPIQNWAGKLTAFGNIVGYYENDDAGGYYPWGFGAELIFSPSKVKKNLWTEISFGAVFAYDRTDKNQKKTVTPNVAFAITHRFEKLGLLNVKVGAGASGVTNVNFINNTEERIINFAFVFGLTFSPDLK